MTGWILLVAACLLATSGFFLSPSIRNRWSRSGLSIILSLSVVCGILVGGYFSRQERHLTDAAGTISQISTGDDSRSVPELI